MVAGHVSENALYSSHLSQRRLCIQLFERANYFKLTIVYSSGFARQLSHQTFLMQKLCSSRVLCLLQPYSVMTTTVFPRKTRGAIIFRTKRLFKGVIRGGGSIPGIDRWKPSNEDVKARGKD